MRIALLGLGKMGTPMAGRLLQAGHKQFSAHGLKKTNIEELAEVARISKGAFYHFYESKEALFMDVIEEVEQRSRREIFAARQWKPMRRRDLAWLAVFPDPFTRLRRPASDDIGPTRVILENDEFPISRCGLDRVAHAKRGYSACSTSWIEFSAGSGTFDLTLVNNKWAV